MSQSALQQPVLSKTCICSLTQVYEDKIAEQSSMQREMNSLLQRKSSWTDADVVLFTTLYRNEHSLDAAVGGRLPGTASFATGGGAGCVRCLMPGTGIVASPNERSNCVSCGMTRLPPHGWLRPKRHDLIAVKPIPQTPVCLSTSQVAEARESHETAGQAVENARSDLMQAIRERYTEEQLWSDKIRRASTWWTWVMMGVQGMSFLALYSILEPRKVGGTQFCTLGMGLARPGGKRAAHVTSLRCNRSMMATVVGEGVSAHPLLVAAHLPWCTMFFMPLDQ